MPKLTKRIVEATLPRAEAEERLWQACERRPSKAYAALIERRVALTNHGGYAAFLTET